MKNLFRAVVKKLTKKPLIKLRFEDLHEEAIVMQVRSALWRARDYYAMRGRNILAVDIQTHLDFFDEAVKFDRLEQEPVLLAVNTDRN